MMQTVTREQALAGTLALLLKHCARPAKKEGER